LNKNWHLPGACSLVGGASSIECSLSYIYILLYYNLKVLLIFYFTELFYRKLVVEIEDTHIMTPN